MAATTDITLSDQLKKLPPSVRSIVQAARRTVKAAAPEASEIIYQSQPPRSKSYMWKMVRYAVDGRNVVGIGAFSAYAALFFYRGREIDDGGGVLQGGGKEMRAITLRVPADAQRPAVARIVRRAFKLGG
jgi:uncharacterized protein YdeI (YjbR/CyaY-like superfamily)